jgi:hypothetical protein
MPSVLDARGRPAVLGGGPLTYRCLEPFARWLVSFDGMTAYGMIERSSWTAGPSHPVAKTW